MTLQCYICGKYIHQKNAKVWEDRIVCDECIERHENIKIKSQKEIDFEKIFKNSWWMQGRSRK